MLSMESTAPWRWPCWLLGSSDAMTPAAAVDHEKPNGSSSPMLTYTIQPATKHAPPSVKRSVDSAPSSSTPPLPSAHSCSEMVALEMALPMPRNIKAYPCSVGPQWNTESVYAR